MFSMNFIAEGLRKRESCLYISVGRSGEDFVALAKSAGIFLAPEQRIFHPAETEPTGSMNDLLTQVK